MRKRMAVAGIAAALALTPVASASVQAHEATPRQAAVQPTPDPNEDNNDGGGNKGIHGLWGLLGLAGLLGLIPRRPKNTQPGYAPHMTGTTGTTGTTRSDTRNYQTDVRDTGRNTP